MTVIAPMLGKYNFHVITRNIWKFTVENVILGRNKYKVASKFFDFFN
jgi:hypothetical protein